VTMAAVMALAVGTSAFAADGLVVYNTGPAFSGQTILAPVPAFYAGAKVQPQAEAAVPVLDCVKYRNTRKVPCNAVSKIVMVKDPCWKRDKCNPCAKPTCVAVKICVCPCGCEEISSNKDGSRVIVKKGGQRVVIVSHGGKVTVTYH